jgi:chromosome segregation ATPase
MNSYNHQFTKQLDVLVSKIELLEKNIENEQEKIQVLYKEIQNKEENLQSLKSNVEKCKEDGKTLRYHLGIQVSMEKSRRFLRWKMIPFLK